MTQRIAVLPETLANQIAAGEVVERPASVVKELVENAIDASATRILVDLEGAGRGLIRVVDDGEGMSAEDAATAVLRHATSKIRTVEDLAAIGTLGFRGEALPSIASVSRFTLVTRRAEDEAATQLTILGGVGGGGGGPGAVTQLGAPIGTRIEVRDLFFNVPARLKFLKADATEQGHVAELVRGFALGHPHLHFRLQMNQRVVAEYVPARRLLERVMLVLGKDAGRGLYEVALEGPSVQVTGFVSAPAGAKSTASHLYTFVNGRRVKDRTLTHAILAAYAGDLQPGRFPVAVLYLHLDPGAVDVNVHPTKAEVRFAEAGLVHEALGRAIRGTLGRRPWIEATPLPLMEPAEARVAEATRTYRSLAASEALPNVFAKSAERLPATNLVAAPRVTELRFGPASALRPVAFTTPEARVSPVSPVSAPSAAPAMASTAAGPARFIGSVAAGGLALFEQAPGELVAFQLRTARADVLAALRTASATRPLLIPKVFEAPGAGTVALLERPETIACLAELGLWVERFGGRSWQILGVPTITPNAAPEALLVAVLGALEARRSAGLALADCEAAADPALGAELIAESAARAVWDAWHALPAAQRRAALARFSAGDIAARLRHG